MENEQFARRVTPVTILPEIAPMIGHYLSLGFERVPDSDDPRCVGLRAGKTYQILVTTEFFAEDYGPAVAAVLTGRTIPYIWVESIAGALPRLPADAVVLGRGKRSTGEVLVTIDGQHVILAER